mgnify:CR=1 FL=1
MKPKPALIWLCEVCFGRHFFKLKTPPVKEDSHVAWCLRCGVLKRFVFTDSDKFVSLKVKKKEIVKPPKRSGVAADKIREACRERKLTYRWQGDLETQRRIDNLSGEHCTPTWLGLKDWEDTV